MTARAARGSFPYPGRTVAEVDGSTRTRMFELDAISRTRALSDAESIELERLLRRAA